MKNRVRKFSRKGEPIKFLFQAFYSGNQDTETCHYQYQKIITIS